MTRRTAVIVLLFILMMSSCSYADYRDNGSGTSESPYVIRTVEDLTLLASRVNTGTVYASGGESPDLYYVLANDIQLSQEHDWVAIGASNYFSGHFDGKGYTIYFNMRTSEEYSDSRNVSYGRAIFGRVRSSSNNEYAIRNLNAGGSISGFDAGGIATSLYSGIIDNCHVSGDIELSELDEMDYVSHSIGGGIVSFMRGGKITNCSFNGSITSTGGDETYNYARAGGIAGAVHSGDIVNCTVTPTSYITAIGKGAQAGGIAGYFNADFGETISGCSFEGVVSSDTYAGGIGGFIRGGTISGNTIKAGSRITGRYSAGGIAGRLSSGGVAYDNIVEAGSTVQADEFAAGGIVGFLELGKITGGNESYALILGSAPSQGGIVGYVSNDTVTSEAVTGTNIFSGAEYAIGSDENGNHSDAGTEGRSDMVLAIITLSELPSVKVNMPYTVTLETNSESEDIFTWELVSGDLPGNMRLDRSTGTISGTADTVGEYIFTVQVSAGTQSAQKDFSITIRPALSITTNSLLGQVKRGEYFFAALKTDADLTSDDLVVWSITSGDLPEGLELDGATGIISGTPNEEGNFLFTLLADAGYAQASQEFLISVRPAISIKTPSALPYASIGEAYYVQLETDISESSDMSVKWIKLSGDLPAGITLNESTGEISGVTYTAGDYEFTLQVSSGVRWASKTFTLSVRSLMNITNPSELDEIDAGKKYSLRLRTDLTSQKDITWSVVSGDLPHGLTLSSDNGTISGTPDVAGNFTFTIRAEKDSSIAEKEFTLTVRLAVSTDSTLPNGTLGEYYSRLLRAKGAASNLITWSYTGNLPAGLSMSSEGQISGTPRETGTSTFTVIAYVSDDISADKLMSITIDSTAAVPITTTNLPEGIEGEEYFAELTSALENVSWSIESGDLPGGLTLTRDGLISGTPRESGTFTVIIKALSSLGRTGSRKFTIIISPSTSLSINTSELPEGTTGTPYIAELSRTSAYADWEIISGDLPSGLTLSRDTGIITGTPRNSGTYAFTVRAYSGNDSVTRELSITINAKDLEILTDILPDSNEGNFYSISLEANITSGVTWLLLSGTLPPGLTLQDNGIISGTLTAQGEFTFIIRAATQTDQDDAEYTIKVEAPILGEVSSSGGGCNISASGLIMLLSLMVFRRK